MKCNVCGVGTREPKTIDEAFLIDGRWIVVEHIPAEVCSHCGEVSFDAGITDRVRQIVQSGKRPRTAIEADVYEYEYA